jgi:hypothetical protein
MYTKLRTNIFTKSLTMNLKKWDKLISDYSIDTIKIQVM